MNKFEKSKHFSHETHAETTAMEDAVKEFTRLSNEALKRSYDEIEQLKLKIRTEQTLISDLEDKLRSLLNQKRLRMLNDLPPCSQALVKSNRLFSCPDLKENKGARFLSSYGSIEEDVPSREVRQFFLLRRNSSISTNRKNSPDTTLGLKCFEDGKRNPGWIRNFVERMPGGRYSSVLQVRLQNQSDIMQRKKEKTLANLKLKREDRQIAIETLMRTIAINFQTLQNLTRKKQHQEDDRLMKLSSQREQFNRLIQKIELIDNRGIRLLDLIQGLKIVNQNFVISTKEINVI